MLRRSFGLVVATIFFVFQLFTSAASAAELDSATLTVPLNSAGDSITLARRQYDNGQRIFGATCSTCHAGGITKTNPTLDLTPPTLALATPQRDTVEGLVDYFKNPTTYDGETEISELHPSMKSADIYPKMRNLTDQDLADLAGYILVQPKFLGEQWGGGKIYF